MKSCKYNNHTSTFITKKKQYNLVTEGTGYNLLCYFTENRVYFSKEVTELNLYRLDLENVFLFIREGKVIITL